LRDQEGNIIRWIGTNTDIDERKRAEEKLRRSEADLLEAQRMSRTGNLRLDISSGTVTGSPQVFRIFGVKPDEDSSALEVWLGRTHPEDHKRIQELLDSCLIQKTDFDAEYRIVLPDGAIKHIHSLGHPVLNDSGDLVEFGGTIIDITERKQAEEALRRSERDLLEAQRISHTGSWKHDVLSGTVTVSPEVCRIFGVEPGEDASAPEFWLSRNHPEDQKRIRELFERCEMEKTDYEAEYRIVVPDGAIKHLHAIGRPVSTASGDLVEFIGTVLDITERKNAERELRRSEAYLAGAEMLSHTGSFGWRPSTGQIIWSEETFRIFQYDRTTQPTLELILHRVHPEEAAFVRQTIERASRDGKDFDFEHRLLMPDASIKHLRVVGRPSEDESGSREFLGAVMDITDRKRTEEELRRSEAFLLEAQQLSHTGSWMHDVGTGRTWQSPELLRIVGVNATQEDASRGETFVGRIHPEDAPIEAANYVRAQEAKADLEGDFRIILPDGSIKRIHNVAHPKLDESGNLVGFFGIAMDVTEQWEARARLEKAFEEIKELKDRLHEENLALREEIDQGFMFEEIVGSSPALQKVLSSIVRVAPTDSTVLITGETGTGKELIARAIHKRSRRAGQAFVSVNCASIPVSLIASELFGHEKGA
jgi:PAS domain S-box-containing protein